MFINELADKYNVEVQTLKALAQPFDELYLRLTKTQTLKLVEELYNNADIVYNENVSSASLKN